MYLFIYLFYARNDSVICATSISDNKKRSVSDSILGTLTEHLGCLGKKKKKNIIFCTIRKPTLPKEFFNEI